MNRYAVSQIDNRDAGQMYEYLEARIDALKRRITELEAENRNLLDRSKRGSISTSSGDHTRSRWMAVGQ